MGGFCLLMEHQKENYLQKKIKIFGGNMVCISICPKLSSILLPLQIPVLSAGKTKALNKEINAIVFKPISKIMLIMFRATRKSMQLVFRATNVLVSHAHKRIIFPIALSFQFGMVNLGWSEARINHTTNNFYFLSIFCLCTRG